jgi:hypothetical protein
MTPERLKEIKSIIAKEWKDDLKIQKNTQKSLSKISEPFQTKIIDKIHY